MNDRGGGRRATAALLIAGVSGPGERLKALHQNGGRPRLKD